MVEALGGDHIQKNIDLINIYYCGNIDALSDSFIEQANITTGVFDNVTEVHFGVSYHWGIGKMCKPCFAIVEYGSVCGGQAFM